VYNDRDKGEQEYSGIDMNANNALELNGTDRITRSLNLTRQP
jgi:hypothetical protein